MSTFIEHLLARVWNRVATERKHPQNPRSLALGYELVEGQVQKSRSIIPQSKRPEHVAILGKTGTGKSSLLRFLATQDIQQERGFCFFDLHGDATPALMRVIAEAEQTTGRDY